VRSWVEEFVVDQHARDEGCLLVREAIVVVRRAGARAVH
jgi:hypothetical protein